MKLVAINTIRPAYSVEGELSLRGRDIFWSMKCVSQNEKWQMETSFSEDYRKNWQLWNFDVLETFLQLRSHPEDFFAPYLELQISPLNQPLALIIIKPRESFFTPLNLVFSSQVTLSKGESSQVWKLEAKIVLPDEIQGHQLWGGMFACLGQGEREFHAPSPWGPLPADFHQPKYFQQLT